VNLAPVELEFREPCSVGQHARQLGEDCQEERRAFLLQRKFDLRPHIAIS